MQQKEGQGFGGGVFNILRIVALITFLDIIWFGSELEKSGQLDAVLKGGLAALNN